MSLPFVESAQCNVLWEDIDGAIIIQQCNCVLSLIVPRSILCLFGPRGFLSNVCFKVPRPPLDGSF